MTTSAGGFPHKRTGFESTGDVRGKLPGTVPTSNSLAVAAHVTLVGTYTPTATLLIDEQWNPSFNYTETVLIYEQWFRLLTVIDEEWNPPFSYTETILIDEPWNVDTTSLNTSLVAFWTLNETSGTRFDSIDANDLTDHNSVGSAAGQIGNAATFNGTNQFLDITDNADLSMPTSQSFTISMWINPSSLVNGATPLNKGTLIFTSTNFEYAIEFIQSIAFGPIELFFLTSNNAGSNTVNSGIVLTTGVWHFVVVWFDSGGTISIQIDNGTVTSNSSVGSSDQAHNFNLGSSGSGGAFFPGSLDAVGIWKRVLTADERALLWNNGNGRETPF